MQFINIIYLFTILLCTTTLSWGLEEQIKNFRGVRSAGMGGIATTTGNYGEALFNNPARHCEVDVWKIALLDLTVEINSNLYSTYSKISEVKGASGSGTLTSASALIGRNEHVRVQVMPGFYHPHLIGDLGVALGILASAQTNLLVNYTTDIDTQTFVDTGLALGFAHPFLDNTLSLGFNIRSLYRIAADDSLSALNFLGAGGNRLTLQTFGRQGIGVDADFGAYYKIPWEISFMRLAVGFSVNNMIKSHYDEYPAEILKGVGNRPSNNDRTVAGGLRFDFPDTKLLKAPLFAIEMQDVGGTSHLVSTWKSLHLGGETRIARFFAIRAGLYQGYPAGGFGIDLPVLKLDFATYGEELTGNAGGLEDRRYVARVAFEL